MSRISPTTTASRAAVQLLQSMSTQEVTAALALSTYMLKLIRTVNAQLIVSATTQELVLRADLTRIRITAGADTEHLLS